MKIKVGDICIFKNGSGKTLKVKVNKLRPSYMKSPACDVTVLEDMGGWGRHHTRLLSGYIERKVEITLLLKYMTPIKISLDNK